MSQPSLVTAESPIVASGQKPAEPPIESVVRPSKSLFDFDWAGIWNYRDLIFLLVRRDFISKYRQTILGPAWFVFQPLVTTLLFVLVFNRVAKISTDGLPPTLFYLTGLITWNYFNTAFSSISGCLLANAGVFGKVYFPRLIPPIASSVSAMFSVAIQLVTWVVVYLVVKSTYESPDSFGVTFFSPLVLLLILQTGILSIGFGLIMATATAKYRDLTFTTGFLLQAWLYLTPVIYPISRIPEQWRWVASLNPMTAIVEGSREVLLGRSALTVEMMAISLAITVISFVVGVVIFNRIQKTFVDIL